MARTTAMSVRLEAEVRDRLDEAAQSADCAAATLAARLIAAGLEDLSPDDGVLNPDCQTCRWVAAAFADVDPLQRWLAGFLEETVVHNDDEVAATIAAGRLLDELTRLTDG